jgi:hypothetical protein
MGTREAIVVRDEQPDYSLVLTPVMNIEIAKKRLAEFQEFVRGYLVEGEDFGTIPGTPKPTLLKPGADKLCELYGMADEYEILTQVEKFESDPPLFDYTVKCILTSRRDGRLVATGLGSCNSYEGKYKWRDSQRVCPNCKQACIIKGKEEYGGGWLCFAKKGGCGAKFGDGDELIEGQKIGRVPNDDIATIKNTILKMAKKRAKIDATLGATRSSGIFTQDMEDIQNVTPEPERKPGTVERESGARPIPASGYAPRGTMPANAPKNSEVFLYVGQKESTVSGATYALKDHFKNLSGKFDGKTKSWFIPSARTHELLAIAQKLKLQVTEVNERGEVLEPLGEQGMEQETIPW